ncbi:MAG: bifunctional hydroxymethylpyrimidine kinase/phosphomethylpyrimidine kinase [Chloroflexota bacterium]|nr:bifunctional hydroxymethylpyrimidine kinase/phosphomethylpyrimidine kinase [Chloroflexota bacterium]MDE2884240.1 bifunctional hydroxymethylpyrimidine kinase/phosphomethylpyrimidine kinase [Chloroflexota bacterium]
MSEKQTPIALTIAGSDSGGGAGIQADLKTFAAFEVYGASALTAVTAQNTLGVTAVHELPVDVVHAQIDAVATDLGMDAVKTGMLSSAAIIDAVAERLESHGVQQLVVDPVMVAKGGDRLLREDAVAALASRLLPLALVSTPNAEEAAALCGHPVQTMEQARGAAQAIHGMGCRYVVVKGGHFGEDAVDVLYDGSSFTEFPAKRIATTSTHGTGCTFASAVAAGLARGGSVESAVSDAKAYVTAAIAAAPSIGAGHGPLHHFHAWWA